MAESRRVRGPRVSTDVRVLILNVFDELWQRGGGGPDYLPTGVAVWGAVLERMAVNAARDATPSLRVVQKILAGPRAKAREMGDETTANIDVPWSLAWGLDPPDPLIPNEAIPDLLELKKYSIIVGQPFTVRQARWAARLRLIPKARAEMIHSYTVRSEAYELNPIAGLYDWTIRFANRQRRVELAGRASFDSSDFEALLVMDDHVYVAAMLTELVPPIPLDEHEPVSFTARVEHHVLSGFADRQLADAASAALGVLSEHRREAALDMWHLWLHELRRHGTTWTDADAEDLRQLALTLLEQIVAFYQADGRGYGFPPSWTVPYLPPTELAESVGYRSAAERLMGNEQETEGES